MSVDGSLYGLAYGDALGKPTEFLSVAEIEARFGPGGPRDLPGLRYALVTDDTQMALAVADGLLVAMEKGPLTAATFEPPVRGRFLRWLVDPENNRAPGLTCLNACQGMADGKSWLDATVIGSKGCGANMRVTPIALPDGLTDDERSGAAQLQAAMTHGHPTALAASELTMYAVRWALDGVPPGDLPGLLRDRCASQRTIYRDDWISTLSDRAGQDSTEWIARGWDDCLHVLDLLDHALARPDRDADPCRATGAGWIAEEALATALHCVLLFPDDPVSALARAATTSGDSDSIAALAGAIIGAAHGMDAWPDDWRDRIEYGPELARIAESVGGLR
jgi:ADP-ribosylglycohydrolase